MNNIDRLLKQEGGTDVVGEKLFQLYLAVKEVIKYRRLVVSARYDLQILYCF